MEASVEIYNRMSVDLLPTPAKSHYVFNLRDLSKCVQGSVWNSRSLACTLLPFPFTHTSLHKSVCTWVSEICLEIPLQYPWFSHPPPPPFTDCSTTFLKPPSHFSLPAGGLSSFSLKEKKNICIESNQKGFLFQISQTPCPCLLSHCSGSAVPAPNICQQPPWY